MPSKGICSVHISPDKVPSTIQLPILPDEERVPLSLRSSQSRVEEGVARSGQGSGEASQRHHQMLDSDGQLGCGQVGKQKRACQRERQRRRKIWKWSCAWPSQGVCGARVGRGVQGKARGRESLMGEGLTTGLDYLTDQCFSNCTSQSPGGSWRRVRDGCTIGSPEGGTQDPCPCISQSCSTHVCFIHGGFM